MYRPNEDRVVEVSGVPAPDVGAPLPTVVASEQKLLLAYACNTVDPGWDGTTVRVVDRDTPDQLVALIKFGRPYAHCFGPPNDEAFSGHPLATRGLRPYSVSEIVSSSWIVGLEKMNSVHPNHDPARFDSYRHFVFAFHDSTFECVAESMSVEVEAGRVVEMTRRMADELS